MSTVGPGGADWDDIYTGDGTDTEPFDAQMLSDALDLPPGAALDVGCGAGGNAIGLARRGWTTTGVDSSSKAISSACISAEVTHLEVKFLQEDITTWKPDGLFDLVISLFALPPRGADREAVLALARQALAPGGLLIMGEWETIDDSPEPYVTLRELSNAFSDWEIINAGSVDANPDPHRGNHAIRSWRAVKVTARRPR